MKVSITILNHDGVDYLKACIPSVIRAKNNYSEGSEIIVVDNASSDQSLNYLQQFTSELRVLPLKDKLFFTQAMNAGIKESRFPIVICLNNDITVNDDFIQPLVSHFTRDKDVFAAAAKMLFQDSGDLNFGRVTGDFRYGFFSRRITDAAVCRDTLYASGGGFAVDREKFFQIGGFDEDIDVYWEDLDLCYRAWKQGFKVVYEPRSIIHHKFHGTNLNKIGKKGIDLLSGYNYSLFILKNIHDKGLIAKQILFTPLLILSAIVKGKFYFAKGMFKALSQISLFLAKRAREKDKSKFSDRQVLKLSSQ